jgi:hypothetical protein
MILIQEGKSYISPCQYVCSVKLGIKRIRWNLELDSTANADLTTTHQHGETNVTHFPFDLLIINPLTSELNPSAQRYLTRYFTGGFASWTVHFVNVCEKNQQMQQLFIHFINYVWYLLHVSALHCHPQGAFLVPSERCSIDQQSIEYCGWACCV